MSAEVNFIQQCEQFSLRSLWCILVSTTLSDEYDLYRKVSAFKISYSLEQVRCPPNSNGIDSRYGFYVHASVWVGGKTANCLVVSTTRFRK